MALFFGINVEQVHGPDVAINCPACKRVDTLADTYENTETVMLLWVLPTYRHRNTVVVCHGCGKNLYSRLRIHQLTQASPDELDKSLSLPIGMLIFALCTISIMTLCFPFINLVPSVALVIVNRKTSGMRRIAGYIPLVLAIIASITSGIALTVHYLNGGP